MSLFREQHSFIQGLTGFCNQALLRELDWMLSQQLSVGPDPGVVKSERAAQLLDRRQGAGDCVMLIVFGVNITYRQ